MQAIPQMPPQKQREVYDQILTTSNLWVFAEKLMIKSLQNVAIDQLERLARKHRTVPPLAVIRYVVQNTSENLPLRKMVIKLRSWYLSAGAEDVARKRLKMTSIAFLRKPSKRFFNYLPSNVPPRIRILSKLPSSMSRRIPLLNNYLDGSIFIAWRGIVLSWRGIARQESLGMKLSRCVKTGRICIDGSA